MGGVWCNGGDPWHLAVYQPVPPPPGTQNSSSITLKQKRSLGKNPRADRSRSACNIANNTPHRPPLGFSGFYQREIALND